MIYIGSTLTNREFLNRVDALVGSEYTFNEPYTKRHNKMSCTHNSCGYTWCVEAGAFLGNKNKMGSRCPNCFGNTKKTTKQFLEEVDTMYNGEYTVVDSYINARTKIKIRHELCGTILFIAPNTFLGGVGCSSCNGGIPLTHSKVKKEIHTMTEGTYELVNTYDNCFSELHIRHVPCNHVAKTTLALIRTHKRVPPCKLCYSFSGEELVSNYLLSKGIRFDTQVYFDNLRLIKRLSYDFILPNNNVLIEYQGVQHYKPVKHFGGVDAFKVQQHRDELKRTYAKENGYMLIEVPYTENTQEKVNSFLNNALSGVT